MTGRRSVAAAALAVLAICGVVAQRAPAPSAEVLLTAALKTAQAENKAVFVDFGAQTWCAPCRKLRAFLEAPETKKIFDAHYVVLNLTVWENHNNVALNNPGAEALMKKWGQNGGIPFYAFLDAAGAVLSTSTPLPNQAADGGYPGSKGAIQAFGAALEKTAPRMTAAERTILLNYLTDHSNGLATIAGRVNDERGNPVTKATVSMIRRVYVGGKWVTVQGPRTGTDASGNYAFKQLVPASYRLLAQARRSAAVTQAGEAADMVALYPANSRAAETTWLAVGPNHDVAGADISVVPQRSARVSGTVLDASGKAQSGSSVTLTNLDWPLSFFAVRTGADGTFAVSQVLSGRYSVWARGDGTAPGGPPEIGFASIRVAGTDLQDLRITITEGATLTGRVVFDGAPLSASEREGIRVTAVPVSQEPGAASGILQSRVEPDGQFAMRGAFGARAIRVENLPDGWLLKTVRVAAKDVTDTPIALKGHERVADIHIAVTNRSAELSGSVLDSGGKPIASGAIIVFAEDSSRWNHPSRFVRMAPVQDNGSFVVRALPAGRYRIARVELLAPDWDSPEAIQELRNRATTVSLGEGERKTVNVQVSGATTDRP